MFFVPPVNVMVPQHQAINVEPSIHDGRWSCKLSKSASFAQIMLHRRVCLLDAPPLLSFWDSQSQSHRSWIWHENGIFRASTCCWYWISVTHYFPFIGQVFCRGCISELTLMCFAEITKADVLACHELDLYFLEDATMHRYVDVLQSKGFFWLGIQVWPDIVKPVVMAI